MGRKDCYAKNVYSKITKLSPPLLMFFVVLVHKTLVTTSQVSVDSLDSFLMRPVPFGIT